MTDKDRIDDVHDHLLEVGMICTGWAYLEFLLECAVWWLIGLHNNKRDGRIFTSGLSLETMARKAADLKHLKISCANDRKAIEDIRDRISAIVQERNLAVHGLRAADPDGGEVTAEVSRGTYKSQPQKLSLVRLRSLNAEIGMIMAITEPLLVRYGVIEHMTDFSAQLQSLQQEHKAP